MVELLESVVLFPTFWLVCHQRLSMRLREPGRIKAQHLEYAVHGTGYADQWQGKVEMVQEGAQLIPRLYLIMWQR